MQDCLNTFNLYTLFSLDYCDIPDLMNHLQTNYKLWKEMEDKPKDTAPTIQPTEATDGGGNT